MAAIYGNTILAHGHAPRHAGHGRAAGEHRYCENVTVTATRPGVVGVVVTDVCG
jgi:hypothetical protein